MKGIVAFDSMYGNTKNVAEAMADEIRAQGHEVALVNIGQTLKFDDDGDFILIGSPTRMKQMTFRTKRFIKKVRKKYVGKPGAAFETTLRVPTDPVARRRRQVDRQRRGERSRRWPRRVGSGCSERC